MKNMDYIRLYIMGDKQTMTEFLLSVFLAGYRIGLEKEMEDEMTDPADLIRIIDEWLEAEQL